MLRRRKIAAIVALCLAGLVLASWASTHAASYEVCKQERESSGDKTPEFGKQIAYFFVCEGVTIDSNGELLTALGTLAIAGFTLTLWLVTGEALKLGRDEFNATHRATLEVRFVREVAGGIEITVVNVGTGSARFIGARAGIWHLMAGERFPSPHDLLPGNGFELRSIFDPSEMDRHTVTDSGDAFSAGFGSPAHIFGWIVYDTIGPKPVRRTTYFGRRTEVLQPELIPVEGSDWNFIQ